MAGFEMDEVIAASPRRVFEVLSDPSRATEFLENVTESTKLTDGPITTGTRFHETRVVNGKEASAELVVGAYEPDTRVEIGTEAEGISVLYRYELAPEGDGTRVTWTCELQAEGFRKMMLPMVAGVMKKEDGDHLQQLKAYLEEQ
ncbi:SRPBCC family protein [Agromyces marinus]|uniref:Polyketide cyclase / dehydrase and lipid transport n=1 Tax=Agromyces marinus TaxID=1389020 RepID=A0ABN6Y9M4_9MICO|nr:SRPBCC family protein [Agromyces marinus]UIP57758.1 hypothetical protein DSM26151_06240 [Agromyces marinus]BDZ54067.1 hypothetical protein GCM10025870_11400 [Agromyces marinus]